MSALPRGLKDLYKSGIPRGLIEELAKQPTVKHRDVYGTGSRAPQGQLTAKANRRLTKVNARRLTEFQLNAGTGDVHPRHLRPAKKKRTR